MIKTHRQSHHSPQDMPQVEVHRTTPHIQIPRTSHHVHEARPLPTRHGQRRHCISDSNQRGHMPLRVLSNRARMETTDGARRHASVVRWRCLQTPSHLRDAPGLVRVRGLSFHISAAHASLSMRSSCLRLACCRIRHRWRGCRRAPQRQVDAMHAVLAVEHSPHAKCIAALQQSGAAAARPLCVYQRLGVLPLHPSAQPPGEPSNSKVRRRCGDGGGAAARTSGGSLELDRQLRL